MKYLFTFLMVFGCLCCFAQKQAPVGPMSGDYTLTSLKDQKKFFRIRGGTAKVRIDQAAETIQCDMGCNTISGILVLLNGEVSETELQTTEKFCTARLQTIERKFMQQMQRVNRYTYAKRQLNFYDGNELLMVMKKRH